MKVIMTMMLLSLCIFSLFIQTSFAAYGIDVSQATYEPAWQCLKSNGYTFAVIRAYESGGSPDPNGPHTVYNAWAGGMDYVDVYMFPCASCGNPGGQVAAAVNYLRSYNTKYGMFWLDIEGPQYWEGQSYNINFIAGLISAAKSMSQVVGIYTSASQWGPITGNWNGPASEGIPLWYANYDGAANFNDFSPFAGWSHPNVKQYNGNLSICGAGVDQNWYP